MKTVRNEFKSEKLIRVLLEYDEQKKTIHSITISGDFFLYPEDALEKLESSLVGVKLERSVINKQIQDILHDAEAFGFTAESMTEAILGCLSKKNDSV
ncbi:MAG: lipoate protein ligase C-terminal domain-containing protein [Nitrosotalea sp.]